MLTYNIQDAILCAMRVIIDVSPKLFDRLQSLVDNSDYRSVADFATVAFENQLLLESAPSTQPSASLAPNRSIGGAVAPNERDQISRALSPVASTSAALMSVEEHGWIWGIVNRVLPIKFAARQLHASNLILLTDAQSEIAKAATDFAKRILANTPGDRDRHDTLVTGFPNREPLYPAQERFANHYVGRVERSGQTRGALFELGLAGIETSAGTPRIGLTESGIEFAELPNPVIDSYEFGQSLSEDEVSFYIEKVARAVPREMDCFTTILSALTHAPKSVEELDTIAKRRLSTGFSLAAIQTQKAGGLGRLRDLGLIQRNKDGLTANFEITSRGQIALAGLA